MQGVRTPTSACRPLTASVCTNAGNGRTQQVLHLGKPFACRLGEDPRHRVGGRKKRCRLPVLSAALPLDRGKEIHLPVSGADAWCGLPAFVDGNSAGVAGHADTSRGIAVEEDLAGSTLHHGSDPERFLVGLGAFGRCLPFVASLLAARRT